MECFKNKKATLFFLFTTTHDINMNPILNKRLFGAMVGGFNAKETQFKLI